MLLSTLGASVLGNLLTGRGAIANRQGRGIYRAGKGKGVYRAGKGKGKEVLRAGEGVFIAGYGHPSHNKMDF